MAEKEKVEQNSQQAAGGTQKFGVTAPAIQMPKGGGAIRGMGEKFAANPVTGTGSMSVPIATSPGRAGFGPQLSLSYDSGAGNGPFGFGWGLVLPAITRKTDKGLPKYQDIEESDDFILSGAEDLVPAEAVPSRTIGNKTYDIQRYRPRIEGLFARIECWTDKATGEIHWRSISKDNITTWYGKEDNSRITDPSDPARIFSWLICESYDDKGNAITYEYLPENEAGIDQSQANERNRVRTANRYLKRIKYGNQTPRRQNEDLSQRTDWHFEAVFDYGEHDANNPLPMEPGNTWPVRNDPFSTYRAGFEVRTYRLCQRVLMFHHFPDEQDVGRNCLVRSTDFTYSYEEDPHNARNPIFSFLLEVTQTGYKKDGAGYLSKSLPPLVFEYSQPIINEDIHAIDPKSLENLPYGLDGGRYQWVDLEGEGLSGILTEQAEGWFYKHNLSPLHEVIQADGSKLVEAQFAPLEQIAHKPSLAALSDGRQQLLDLAGDGQLDLVELAGPMPGFYERTAEEDWESFRTFESLPNLDWGNPNLKFIDLTGDGHADILISENEVFCWHPSLAEAGFGPPETVRKVLEEEKGPRLVFADGTQSIYLADMSGDGLTDLVRIRNGEVCYWPNLGYGQFGMKVTMDHAPWFDHPDLFDQKRLHLADIDGSGVTDILYLSRKGVRLYFNQSGNGWSAATELTSVPATDNAKAVTVVDLLGNGTACLVWSSPLPADTRQPMHYLDLMGGQKPHLLVTVKNNLGAETRVRYVASTRFYLEDKQNGKPWITKIPFPVHVVERVETYDRISRNRFVTRYAYHHGYFDGIEREFRGFGMVEQWDTEEFTSLAPIVGEGWGEGEATNWDTASHVPPAYTKTWFHTGVYLNREHISNFFAGLLDINDVGEYYREPGLTDEQAKKLLLDDTVLPGDLTIEEEREACRALKGSILRQEVYAEDGTAKSQYPYTVAERNYTIECLQSRGENKHAVFFAHPRESLTYHYERDPANPRVQHELVLEVDKFGNVLKSVAIGYGRKQSALEREEDQNKQTRTLITYIQNSVTDPIVDQDDVYRTPLPSETKTYETTGFTPTNNAILFSIDEFMANDFALLKSASEIPYEQTADLIQKQKRLIEHVRTLYRRNDLIGPCSLGTVEFLALPYESYKLAFTPSLLIQAFGTRIDNGMLSEGGYVHSEGDANWWIPSGQIFYHSDPDATPEQELAEAQQHFFLSRRFRDPFGNETDVTYDAYDLAPTLTRDAVGNEVAAEIDYRVLQPTRMTDPNGNQSEVRFDALGMVAGTAVMGKLDEHKGDTFDDFKVDLDQTTDIDAFFANPKGTIAATLLGTTTSRIIYDLDRFQRTGQPPFAATIVRETHVSDLIGSEQSKLQVSFSYSDGFGREIQKKIQAEPGSMTGGGPLVNPRWVGSGWTVFNNKGKPVRQYEPFFDDTHDFKFANKVGVSPILFYDPLVRVVATLHPNHTYEKVVFDPWQQTTYDVNDTVTFDPFQDDDVKDFFVRNFEASEYKTWHTQRKDGALGAEEQKAAKKAAKHANTPTIAHFDTLGRTFLTLAHNGFNPDGTAIHYATRVELDIEGNQRAVIDARDRIVMQYDYDMLGVQIHSASMEAGERWMLNDVTGKPIRSWDSRGHAFRTEYDALRRPLYSYVKGAVENEPEKEILFAKTVYGENQTDDKTLNLRTRVYKSYDSAGMVISDAYDFKGNLLHGVRQLTEDYKNTPDWAGNPALQVQQFSSATTYDALNRPLTLTTPDGSIAKPEYNEANLLNAMRVHLRGAATPTGFVRNIDYTAKGQRELIAYGNGVETRYEYDPLTFRLTHLLTLRGSERLQDLRYTYDPAGNITHIRDDARQTIYFNNQVVEPECDYVYDAIYRLIEARGREHIGQVGQPETSWSDEFRVNLPHPGDGQAMRNYTEQYVYDSVGNFEKLIHQANNGNWTRPYAYNEASLIESGKMSNRLSSTTVGATTESYTHDAHGNMTSMPHLHEMTWDFKDQLHSTRRQMENNGNGGITYYVYDGAGQRARKITERQNSTQKKNERIYLGGFEIYREYNGNGETLKLERETLHVMDDKQRIALVETRAQGDDNSPAQLLRYQLGNHLGSTSLELDEAGKMISYEEYYPYGSTSYQAVDKNIKAAAKRYRYTGKERDEETGLYYHGARYYAGWLGRWVSIDPSGTKDGINVYCYVRLNPIVSVDTSGRETITAIETYLRERLSEQIPEINWKQRSDPDTPSWYLEVPGLSPRPFQASLPPIEDRPIKSAFGSMMNTVKRKAEDPNEPRWSQIFYSATNLFLTVPYAYELLMVLPIANAPNDALVAGQMAARGSLRQEGGSSDYVTAGFTFGGAVLNAITVIPSFHFPGASGSGMRGIKISSYSFPGLLSVGPIFIPPLNNGSDSFSNPLI